MIKCFLESFRTISFSVLILVLGSVGLVTVPTLAIMISIFLIAM